VEDERWLGDPFAYEEDAQLPPSTCHGAACVVPFPDGSELLYSFGGRRQSDGTLSDELWCLDPRELRWHEVETDAKPAARELHSITRVLTRYLFVHGGRGVDNEPLETIDLFDLQTATWVSKRPEPPLLRLGAAAGAAGGCLYIYGGLDATGTPTNAVHAFEVHADFPQVAALQFDSDPAKGMLAKNSASFSSLTERFSVEAWVYPTPPKADGTRQPADASKDPSQAYQWPGQGVCVVRTDASMKSGFGLVTIDEAAARRYVALDKYKPPETGQPKERNPWESCLADAEQLPTMAFFVGGLKKETAALLRVTPYQWSHVAASFDGKALITYVNGVRADYFVLDPPLEEQGGLSHPKEGELAIGGFAGRYAFDGLIDGVRVWNHPISWEEVRERMNDTLVGLDYPTLVGQWSCNEGAGVLCVDSSKFRNDGTLEGDVQRALCTRDHVEIARPKAEQHIDQSYERLRVWMLEFEKRAGRPVQQADLLLADESIRKTAKRLGQLN